MPKVIPINEPVTPAEYSQCMDATKFESRGRKYTHNNKEYEIVIKKRTLNEDGPGKICLAALAILCTLGIVLCFKPFKKWLLGVSSVRFAIPTQKIQELKEKPKAGEVTTKINDLKNFYYTHFIATNNRDALDEIVNNCLEGCQTIQELETVCNFIQERVFYKRQDATACITNKLRTFGVQNGDLKTLIYIVIYFTISDKEIRHQMASRILTEEKHELYMGEVMVFRKDIIEEFDFANPAYSLDVLSKLIPPWSDMKPCTEIKEIAVKSTKTILNFNDRASKNSLTIASNFALLYTAEFSSKQLEKAVRTLLADPALPNRTLVTCLTYIACNKASFTQEEKTSAIMRYQTLNDSTVLAGLMTKLFD